MRERAAARIELLPAQHYAKAGAELLVVHPRALGSKSSALLETHEPRHNPVEKTDDLKQLYRTIESDEHATAVLTPDGVAR